MRIATPWYLAPSGGEAMYCYFGTFTEDMGVDWFEWFHHPVYGHHMRISKVDSDPNEFPDGEFVDCLDTAIYGAIGPQRNLFNATEPGLLNGAMRLSEGMGVVISEGDRFMIQSHFINVTDEDILVQDLINLGTLLPGEIEFPVSTWTFTGYSFDLAPNDYTAVTNTCQFPNEVNITMMMVHMHEWGTSFESSLVGSGGGAESLYELPVWHDEWRTRPPIAGYDPAIPIPADQAVEFTCNYFNDEDQPISWPTEMCVLEGMAYPLERSVDCVDGSSVP